MIVGIDSSIVIASVHANHPLHKPSSLWLNSVFENHEAIIAPHSILESFAVLTRLPSPYRVSPVEAQTVLRETLFPNAGIAPFTESSIWDALDRFAEIPVHGGATYDAFIINILIDAGVEYIATYNVTDFRRLAGAVPVTNPLE